LEILPVEVLGTRSCPGPHLQSSRRPAGSGSASSPSSRPTAALPADFDAAAAAGQVQRNIPGLLDVFEADNPGMHTSGTVDVDFVLSGEVDVELDDGVEVHLKAGDVLVQHGTRHAWRNKSAGPCVLVVAVTGTSRA
jgi:mannose-6-phosphate isomerase-like protein (cupin superfamily)